MSAGGTRFPTRADYAAALRSTLRRAGVANSDAAECIGTSRSRMSRVLSGRAPLYAWELLTLAIRAKADAGSVVKAAYEAAGLLDADGLQA